MEPRSPMPHDTSMPEERDDAEPLPVFKAPEFPPGFRYDRERVKLQSIPFLSNEPLAGPAGCKEFDFRRPRLRRCPFDINTINWKDATVLGYGMDGWVWRVRFGDGGPFALKLFWVAERPFHAEYFAVQRECQVVAHLQMIQAAVDQAAREGGARPVRINPASKTWLEAAANVFAFAEENRGRPAPDPEIDKGLVPLTKIPRMTQCYGWLRFDTDAILPRLPRRLRPHPIKIEKTQRWIEPGQPHIALVYEYVDDKPNDPAQVARVVDFMHCAGFCVASSPHGRNWKNSQLVDYSEFMGIYAYGWHTSRYKRLETEIFLRTTLQGPNDLIYGTRGNLYFTDQGQTGISDPTGKVYWLVPDGWLNTLVENGVWPNGLSPTPDEHGLHAQSKAPYKDSLTEQHHRCIFWERYILDRWSFGVLDWLFAVAEAHIAVDLPVDAYDETIAEDAPHSGRGLARPLAGDGFAICPYNKNALFRSSCTQVVYVVLCLAWYVMVQRENRRRDRVQSQLGLAGSTMTDEETRARILAGLQDETELRQLDDAGCIL
ncbi:Six-bladed beta-propeller, TolB-like protein [Niveomyces insectorum RCEF 264]|uniref:Six-bladed beta-propeller, TolB-like protein n=1 Tax=Niveomyces insectorum RCEF 264 TaxID=1081102 RepID=A0A167VHB4_9HYPO|nr:Six-bladed beta-propeller, TolB-like protein [Niveomyces insectorum RCEF 264]